MKLRSVVWANNYAVAERLLHACPLHGGRTRAVGRAWSRVSQRAGQSQWSRFYFEWAGKDPDSYGRREPGSVPITPLSIFLRSS